MEEITQDALYFTFKLGEGMFAIPVTSVKEVMNYEPCTYVPKTLPYMSGVLNIRGTVISIIDFRTLFGFSPVTNIEKTTIIVAETTSSNGEPFSFGIIADGVDVVTSLENVPSDTCSYGSLPEREDFILAVGKRNESFILVLDLKKILQSIESEISHSITFAE